MDQNTINEGKILGFIAYLTLFGTLIAFFMNLDKKNLFTSFHVKQALGLGLIYIIVGFLVSSLDNINVSMVFWILFAGLYFYGLLGALNGKMNKLPLLGDIFQKGFDL